jgi:hypothetical protein
MNQTLGYARGSTADQNLDLQVEELTAGCHRIFVEHATGARAERPELAQGLDHLRSGDTLVVWRLDRLARSLRDLIDLVTTLEERGVGFRSPHERVRSDPRAGVARTPVALPRSDPKAAGAPTTATEAPHSAAPNATLALGVARQVPCTRRLRHAAWHSAVALERSPRPPADSPAGFSRDRRDRDGRRSGRTPSTSTFAALLLFPWVMQRFGREGTGSSRHGRVARER